MRRARMAGAACALTLAAAAAVGHAGTAGAVAPDRTGWWFEAEQFPAVLPVPAVPAGGMLIQQSPNGPIAYGAVHYTVPAGAGGTLVLDIGSSAPPSATTPVAGVGAALEACPISQRWQPTDGPGAWSSRPAYGAPCIVAILATDGSAAAFAIDPSLTGSGSLNLAIVPSDSSQPFAAVINKPDANSLRITSAPLAAPPSDQSTAAPPANQASAPSVGTGLPGGAAAALTLPSSDASLPGDASTALSSPPSSPTILEAAAPQLAATRTKDNRTQRIVAVVALFALVAAWWFVGSQPSRAPRRVGVINEERAARQRRGPAGRRVAGVGRFARPRSGRPRRV